MVTSAMGHHITPLELVSKFRGWACWSYSRIIEQDVQSRLLARRTFQQRLLTHKKPSYLKNSSAAFLTETKLERSSSRNIASFPVSVNKSLMAPSALALLLAARYTLAFRSRRAFQSSRYSSALTLSRSWTYFNCFFSNACISSYKQRKPGESEWY